MKLNGLQSEAVRKKVHGQKVEEEVRTLKKVRKSYQPKEVETKAKMLEKLTSANLAELQVAGYDTSQLKGNIENLIGLAQVPIGLVGPVTIKGRNAMGDFYVPMATTEGAMVMTYDLGARLLHTNSEIYTEVISNVMHITAIFPFEDAQQSKRLEKWIYDNYDKVKVEAEKNSRHTTLLEIEQYVVSNNHLLKFKYNTADAHGLNMINQATFNACEFISAKLGMDFFHRSHFSGVKHSSPQNLKEGYGRCVKASVVIPQQALKRLSVTAMQVKDFCDRCIECGGAAGIEYINVHAANAIAAISLACGQDMADLSSSHFCKGKTELVNRAQDLYWEIELPNLLVATVGGGTGLPTQRTCLEMMGCSGSGSSDKLAEIIAASVLCGEYTTAAAVVNKTYVEAHNLHGRNPPVAQEHIESKVVDLNVA